MAACRRRRDLYLTIGLHGYQLKSIACCYTDAVDPYAVGNDAGGTSSSKGPEYSLAGCTRASAVEVDIIGGGDTAEAPCNGCTIDRFECHTFRNETYLKGSGYDTARKSHSTVVHCNIAGRWVLGDGPASAP